MARMPKDPPLNRRCTTRCVVTRSLVVLARCVAVASLSLLLGCASRARVEFIALDYSNIDPPAPAGVTLTGDECYWWEEDDGRLRVAVNIERNSLVGDVGALEFQMALTLERAPAGKARNYNVTRREMRAAARFGPLESRYAATAGVLALYRENQDRLRGSFRLRAARETASLFGGWSPAAWHLLQGEFIAVHDEEAGRAIVDRMGPEDDRPLMR